MLCISQHARSIQQTRGNWIQLRASTKWDKQSVKILCGNGVMKDQLTITMPTIKCHSGMLIEGGPLSY